MNKRKIKKPKSLKQICEDLWKECVKARARYKSELSGKEGRQIGGEHILHPHHIYGKPTYRLRYELDNGICLTAGEHQWGIHHEGRRKEYEQKIYAVIGEGRRKRLEAISKFKAGSTDLMGVKLYLEQELRKYKNAIS